MKKLILFLLTAMTVFTISAYAEKPSYNIETALLTGSEEDTVIKEVMSISPEADVWSVLQCDYNFDVVPKMAFRLYTNDTYLASSTYSLMLLYTMPDGNRSNMMISNPDVSSDGTLSFVSDESMSEALKDVYTFNVAVLIEQ